MLFFVNIVVEDLIQFKTGLPKLLIFMFNFIANAFLNMFKKGFLFFFGITFSLLISAQVSIPFRHFSADNYSVEQIKTLKQEYSNNKTIPEEFELATLIALSSYPELKDTEIEFITKGIKTTMAARPKMNLIFKKRSARTYRIFINNDREKLEGVLLSEIPFDAQVGVIAHELAHILDYSQKSTFTIIGNGIAYLSKSYRSNFEKETDYLTIERGFGWQVHHFCQYLHSSPDVPKSYKKYKKSVYFTPEEIMGILNDSGKYDTDKL